MTRIVTDTTCGLPFEITRRLGIPMISQIINLGDQSFREGREIDSATFMQHLCERRVLPKTAAPYVNDFVEAFQELVPTREPIVCIHPSTDLSGTVRSATLAKDSFPNADIRVIDTRIVAGPLGMMVLEAQRLAAAGASADDVEAAVHDMMARARIYFLVDTLEFLWRGGRIGGASRLMGSLLQIKPILTFQDGRIEPFEKERTKRRAVNRIKEVVAAETAHGDAARPAVMHTGGDAVREAEILVEELRSITGAPEVMLMALPPAIATYAGPGALAVSFFAPRK